MQVAYQITQFPVSSRRDRIKASVEHWSSAVARTWKPIELRFTLHFPNLMALDAKFISLIGF